MRLSRLAYASLRLLLPCSLAFFPLDVVVQRLRRFRAPGTPIGEREVQSVDRWLDRLRIPSTCLYRSLARFGIWASKDGALVLVVGVRKGDENLTAHAWLERDGRPVPPDGTLAQDFQPIVRYPARP